MISEIKTIVKNYLSNAMLCDFITGIVESDGIRIYNKVLVPNSIITGNLKKEIAVGDKVKLLRRQGGGAFYILEIEDNE